MCQLKVDLAHHLESEKMGKAGAETDKSTIKFSNYGETVKLFLFGF